MRHEHEPRLARETKTRPGRPRLRLVLVLCTAGLLGGLVPARAAEDPSVVRRKVDLQQMRDIFPKSHAWEEWLKRTGELPPDFAVEPVVASLPDPLRSASNEKVGKEDWPKRRQELLALFRLYLAGSSPGNPGNLRAGQVRSREEAASTVEEMVLEFGPEHRATLHLELIIPKARGPFPVFLTTMENRRWALLAVSRGYVGCLYAASDLQDDTAAWQEIWPEQDWTTLARRCWAISRCLDYLQTLPFVDRGRIGLVGHGWDGKVALHAAATDPRVKAVVASSSGLGGACSFRLLSQAQFGEGIEGLTRLRPEWFHPRLRFFVGREDRLPVDQSDLVACLAPRPCLISTGVHDPSESVWAIELTFYSARRVYDLLGKTEELNLHYRAGRGEVQAEDVETYLDWLETAFGRERFAFPAPVLYPTYPMWQKLSRERVNPKTFPSNSLSGILLAPGGQEITTGQQWLRNREEIRTRILWGLGEAPPFAENRPGGEKGEAPHWAVLLGRDAVPEGVVRRSMSFGNQLVGDLYLPGKRNPKELPAVVWLHPVSAAAGYTGPYLGEEQPYLRLARQGFAVLAFDQIGYGSRLAEVRNFYARYPRWSLLGKQVEDALAAVEACFQREEVDPKRIYLLGYGTGGMTALHAAALDDRVAGVVAVAGFSPMRLDVPDKGTGGVARWAAWMLLQPRLGPFIGFEAHIPYDYHEVLAMIAPRRASLFVPTLDGQASLADVRLCLQEAAKVYELLGHKSKLRLQELPDYNRLSPSVQALICKELGAWAGL